MVGVVPKAEVVTYVVVHTGCVVTTSPPLSPLTRPAYCGVTDGTGSPNVRVGLDAVIVAALRAMVTVPSG